MKILTLSVLAAVFFTCSTESPVRPDSETRYAFALDLSFKDTLTADGRFSKISFSRRLSEWPSDGAGLDAVIRIYRKFGNSEPEPVRTIYNSVSAAYSASDTFFFESALGRQDTLFYGRDTILDPADLYDFTELRYVALVIADPVREGKVLSGGQGGDSCYSAAFAGTQNKTRFVLNSGSQYTEKDVATLSGAFDTAGVNYLVIYRYSAVLPLDSAGVIPVLDTSKANKLFISDSVIMKGRTYFWVRDTAKSVPAGLYRRPDTVDVDTLARVFDVIEAVTGTNMIRFSKTDTLVPYSGRKWVVMRGLKMTIDTIYPDTTYDTTYYDTFRPSLSTFIDIKPFQSVIKLDLDRASIISNFQYNREVCLLTDEIPVTFSAFGDRSFDSRVCVWIATRKTMAVFSDMSKFMTESYTNQFLGTLKWPDCIYETLPETLVTNEYGEARGDILDGFRYEQGYRVSPLATVAMTGNRYHFAGFTVTESPVKPIRPQNEFLHLMVKPGSILGYDTVSFVRQTVGVDSFGKKGTAPGWHMARDFNEVRRYPTVQDYLRAALGPAAADNELYHSILSACDLDLDSNLYRHPMRGVPVASASALNGKKQFMVLAWTKGRYFEDPRVCISMYPDYAKKTTYFWDKVPPAFMWAINLKNLFPQWDPAATAEYAPMCVAGQCTDLSALGGYFDVFLSSRPVQDQYCSVRDVGFGKIKSVSLCFNYHDDFISSNPGTLTRNYLIPTIRLELPAGKLAEQEKAVYEDPKKGLIGFGLADVAFQKIDCRLWQSGLWDMWIETEDDLGNVGLAPYGGIKLEYKTGSLPVRQIEKK